MSVLYHVVLRSLAYRIGALRGQHLASLETSYAAGTLTLAELNDKAPPLTALKDALVRAEESLVREVAAEREHPWRQSIGGVTASLANESALPAVDSLSRTIVGPWGGVYDASDGSALTEQPLDAIRRRVRNANTFFKLPVYHFRIDGGRIYHTRTNVVIRVCAYDAATQRTAVDANSAMLLPDAAEDLLAERAAALLSPQPK